MELLLILIRCEIITILVLPVLFGLLKRRGMMITEKQLAFSLSTLGSLIIGSVYLSFGKPETLSVVPFETWLIAIALSLIGWVFGYLFCRWLYRQWFQQ